jgi:hypothetical protein
MDKSGRTWSAKGECIEWICPIHISALTTTHEGYLELPSQTDRLFNLVQFIRPPPHTTGRLNFSALSQNPWRIEEGLPDESALPEILAEVNEFIVRMYDFDLRSTVGKGAYGEVYCALQPPS